jgi:hypothetical protein
MVFYYKNLKTPIFEEFKGQSTTFKDYVKAENVKHIKSDKFWN